MVLGLAYDCLSSREYEIPHRGGYRIWSQSERYAGVHRVSRKLKTLTLIVLYLGHGCTPRNTPQASLGIWYSAILQDVQITDCTRSTLCIIRVLIYLCTNHKVCITK